MTSRNRRTGLGAGTLGRRRWAVLLAGLIIAVTVVFASAGPAGAASLDNSSPAAGAKLSAGPAQVRLTFDQIVLFGTASVSVTGPGGSVTSGGVQVLGVSVVQNLRSGLGAGRYQVDWQLSGLLMRTSSGGFSFTIASTSGSEPKPTRSKAPKPKPTASATPTSTPTRTPTPTSSSPPSATGTDGAAVIAGRGTSPTPSAGVAAESAPKVQGVGYTGSGKLPSPPVIWGILLLIAAAGWVVVRVRRSGS